jgi:WD40 repeat protein
VVAGGTDGTVTLGRADSTRTPRTIGRHEGSQISSVLWMAGHHVATCGTDGSLAMWSTDQDLGAWYRQAHRGPVLCIAASPSGTVLVTGGADNSVKLWESKTGRPLACLPCPGRVHNAAVHPHAPVVAAGGDGGLVCIAEAIGLKIVW